MNPKKIDLLPSTLDLLVVKALALRPFDWLGIPRRIAQITGETSDAKPGSLFSVFHGMQQAG